MAPQLIADNPAATAADGLRSIVCSAAQPTADRLVEELLAPRGQPACQ